MALLFTAGVVGGALNAIAGGGSFVAFPALMFTGVPPIPANATNCFALWAGANASGGAFSEHLDIPRRVSIPILVAGFVGGVAGAFLLVKTPAHTFLRVLPWLMLGATLLFIFAKKLSPGAGLRIGADATQTAIAVATIFELVLAVYGGYFGGGVGIVNLALLAVLGMTDIHAMNGMKVFLASAINGGALLVFIFKHVIFWPQAVVMTLGALAGGYLGAKYSLKLPQWVIRWSVISIAVAMTLYFFARAYAG